MEYLENIEPNMIRILSPHSPEKMITSPSFQKTPSSGNKRFRNLSNVSADGAIGYESPLFDDSYDTAREHSGGKVKSAARNPSGFLAATWSPPSIHKAQISLQTKLENDRIRSELAEKEKIIQQQKEIIDQLMKEKALVGDRENMFTEDIQVKEFFIAVQEQKLEQMEEECSTRRLQYHEALNKMKKYKNTVKKIQAEKDSLEAKSKNMMSQLSEQMNELQTLALERIQMLEGDILKSCHENDQLRDQVAMLEKQLRVRDDFFEPRQVSRNRGRQMVSEDEDEIDFITEDNYMELNMSTMSHRTTGTVVHSDNEDEVYSPESDENDETPSD